mmetsp:Transcript_36380/g.103978  ORF Transcript_36380/g.103978 Transcript_36380/m.103978 type:complete len:362 (+) Transcript_36380:1192-2277(+)
MILSMSSSSTQTPPLKFSTPRSTTLRVGLLSSRSSASWPSLSLPRTATFLGTPSSSSSRLFRSMTVSSASRAKTLFSFVYSSRTVIMRSCRWTVAGSSFFWDSATSLASSPAGAARSDPASLAVSTSAARFSRRSAGRSRSSSGTVSEPPLARAVTCCGSEAGLLGNSKRPSSSAGMAEDGTVAGVRVGSSEAASTVLFPSALTGFGSLQLSTRRVRFLHLLPSFSSSRTETMTPSSDPFFLLTILTVFAIFGSPRCSAMWRFTSVIVAELLSMNVIEPGGSSTACFTVSSMSSMVVCFVAFGAASSNNSNLFIDCPSSSISASSLMKVLMTCTILMAPEMLPSKPYLGRMLAWTFARYSR